MTAERRLATLETALPPKAAVLLWLVEAHQFGSLPSCVDWLIDQPRSFAPFYRVPEQAEAAVRQTMRGMPHHAVQRAVRGALREAVFLVELVLTLNGAAEEATRLEGLRLVALTYQMRSLTLEAGVESKDDGVSRRWGDWRDLVSSCLTDLLVAEEARDLLERRFFDGRPTLFPQAMQAWQSLREDFERLAGLADGLAHLMDPRLHQSPPVPSSQFGIDLTTLREVARSQALVESTRLSDTARARSLDLLGDTVGAAAIAERLLRSTSTVSLAD